MVWSECSAGVSVAMKVESLERETTRVATLTLPNSVRRQFGISSVKRRRSAGDGFQTTDFGSTGRLLEGFALALLRFVGSADGAEAEGRISVIRSSSLAASFGVCGAADERMARKKWGASLYTKLESHCYACPRRSRPGSTESSHLSRLPRPGPH